MDAGLKHLALSPFGVEVELDATRPLSLEHKEALRSLFRRDGLIVFRSLNLDMQEQIEFCRIFGPVLDSPYENFYVSNARQDGHLGVLELQWHNDVPYLPRPYMAAALHAIDVAPGATSTKFASGLRAFERLPESLRARIGELNGLQVKQRFSDRSNRLVDLQPGDLCTVHPVVAKQAETARPYVFVNENMTALIIGLSPEDSDALLQELFGFLYVQEDVYEHAWRPGDLVIWDNMAVQHARGRTSGDKRTLQRVTITDLGYAQQYAADLSIRDAYGNQELLTPAA